MSGQVEAGLAQCRTRNKQDRAFVISVLPFPKSQQFTDSVTVLSAQNPKLKDVDLNKLLEASFVQNAADRKVGS